MENTIENKAKFFAQYWGQRVLRFKYPDGTVSQSISKIDISLSQIMDDWFLELYPIHKYNFTDRDNSNKPHDLGKWIDCRRSESYALPFMGVDVEKLVSWGWVKLKTD